MRKRLRVIQEREEEEGREYLAPHVSNGPTRPTNDRQI